MITRIFLGLLFAIASLNVWAENAAHSFAGGESDYDSSWYIGAAYGAMSYRQTGLTDFGLKDYRLIIGKQLNRVFDAEVHAGKGSSDTQLVSGVPVTLSVDSYVAGFLKANLTFTAADWDYNRFRLYGMLGGARVQTTSSDPVTTQSGAQNSVSAGVGMEFFLDNVAIQLGYTRYVNGSANNSKYSLDSLHLGFIYQFGGNKVVNGN